MAGAVQAWQSAGDPYQEALCAVAAGVGAVGGPVRSGRGRRPSGTVPRDDRSTAWVRCHSPAPSSGSPPQPASPGSSRPLPREPVLAAALTAGSSRCLPLLAVGRSNAEIAEILVISPRTVGVHVSRILSKLGADRRAQVADLARRSTACSTHDRRAESTSY